MTSAAALALLLGATAVWADGFAHHDELAARRYRELSPETVGSDLDLSRNRRWHRVGFGLRLGFTLLLSGSIAQVAGGGPRRLLLAAVIAGSEMALLFDLIFNRRFRQVWYYAGTTAWLDEWLNRFGVAHKLEAGKVAAALELALLLAGVVGWLGLT